MSRALKRHTENTSPRPRTLTGPCPAVDSDRVEFSQFSKLSSARLVVAKKEEEGCRGRKDKKKKNKRKNKDNAVKEQE